MKLVVNNGQKIGRNDPCSCGSGLKYKKCCANKETQSPPLDPVTMRIEMEAMMGQMVKIIQEKGMSEKEASTYFTGRHMDEIAEEARSFKRTPAEKAEDIALAAYSARSSREAVLIARQALDMDSNCAQAYLVLEQHLCADHTESIKYFKLAIAAAEKTLGKDFFKKNVGHFWGMHETRTYMRAQQYLAHAFWDVSRQSEAIEICWYLLKLNPHDNQGIRYILFDYLLTDNRLAEIEKLLPMYPEDGFAHWEFNKALYFYKKHGPESEKAKKQIQVAHSRNQFVVEYLTGKLKLPRETPDSYTPESKEEAQCYVEDALRPWLNTENAAEWLLSLNLTKSKKTKKSKIPKSFEGH